MPRRAVESLLLHTRPYVLAAPILPSKRTFNLILTDAICVGWTEEELHMKRMCNLRLPVPNAIEAVTSLNANRRETSQHKIDLCNIRTPLILGIDQIEAES